MQYKARVRTPAGRAKYGQEIGEVIVPDIPIGDIEFPKIGEVPEAQLIDNRLMFKPRDGSILDNKPNSDPYPVEWLYRAISDEEWDFINEHGYMQSDGRMNIAEGEGTVATPRDPTFYLPNRVGKRGRVVRIRYTPEDQWWVDHDGYAKTPAKIPIDRIDQVSPWYIAGVPMSDYTEDQLFYDAKNQLSNFVASMPDDYYEDPRPFHDFREPAWELTHSESPDEFYTALKDLADSSGNDVIQQFVTGLLDAVQSSREWMASVQEEKGIRRVRDPAFWGKPYGTRIVPGMKPVAQRPIPGIPPAPQPETPRDQRRVDSAFSWDRSEVRQNAMLVQSAIARAYDVDQITTSPEEYADVFAVLQNYGIEFDEIEGDCNPLLTGDWVYFGECRTIRNAAYDVLGFGTEERTDADPYVYRPDDITFGPGVRHDVAAAKAWAILETLKDAPRSREPLYRGVNLDYVDFDAFTRYMHVGDTFDLPIASFANNKENAQKFGTSVVFKVERGARYITGGQMGMPESLWTSLEEAGETEWIDEDDTGFSEIVTGGRFKVTHWSEDPDMGSLIITIRQVGVFDPNTALVTKAPNERWKYAYLFDDSVRAHKHRTQKSRPRYRVQYKGIRRVRDPEYWGMPYNTPIVPGMKPVQRQVQPSRVEPRDVNEAVREYAAARRGVVVPVNPDTITNDTSSKVKSLIAQDIAQRMGEFDIADGVATINMVRDSKRMRPGKALNNLTSKQWNAVMTGEGALTLVGDENSPVSNQHITVDASDVFIGVDTSGSFRLSFPDLNGNYALPPNPWMTHFDYARPPVKCGSKEANQYLREAVVSRLVSQWAATSNDAQPLSLAIQEVAKEVFGIDNAAPWHVNPPSLSDETHGVIRNFLLAQYAATQEMFAELGVTHVALKRGVRLPPEDADAAEKAKSVQMRPLSAWTTSDLIARNFAMGFADDDSDGSISREPLVFTTLMPVSRVLSTWLTGVGCMSEKEYVVIGGTNKARVTNDLTPRIYISVEKSDTISFNIDNSDINADWLRTMSWDLPTDPDYYVQVYGDGLAQWFQDIIALPAGHAMPAELRIVLERVTSETKSVVRHVRDEDFWGAPAGTPLPLHRLNVADRAKQTGERLGVVSTDDFEGSDQAIYRRAMKVRKRIQDDIIKRTAAMSDEDKQRALENVREARQRGVVMVAAPKDAAMTLLTEDRIKTQFETDTSPTVVAKQTRAVYETAVLDIHPGVDPAKRPVYGYMSVDNPTQRSVGRYGEIRFELKPDVKDRTSITFGDSLGHSVIPIELNSADESQVFGAVAKYAPRYDVDDYQDRKFIEAQIRGGVDVSEIAAVYVPDTDEYADIVEQAESLGITVHRYDYKPQPLVVRAIRTFEVRVRTGLANGLRKLGGETKVRRVRDPKYWGMPYGTPITPGMKPQQLTIPRVGKPKPLVGISAKDLQPKLEAYVHEQYGIAPDSYNYSGQLKQAITERILSYMGDVPTDELVLATLFNNPDSPTRALRLDLLDPENGQAYKATTNGYGLWERRDDVTGWISEPRGPSIGDTLVFSMGDLYIYPPDHKPRPTDPLYDLPPPKHAKVGTPEADQLLREAAVTDLIAVWAMSSNDTNPISLALQECAKDLFKLEGTRDWPSDPERMHEKHQKVYDAFLEAQYMATQHMLASIGVSTIRGYRGMKSRRDSDAGMKRENVVLQTRPLSAWSTHWDIANAFAGSYGTIYDAEIPASRILSLPQTGIGCYSEYELVVLGGIDRRQKFRDHVYMSKSDGLPVVDLDCDDEHADWLRGMVWDLPVDPTHYIGQYGSGLRAWYDKIMSLPAGQAMPPTLRTALLESIVGQTSTKDVRIRVRKSRPDWESDH